MNFEIKEKSNHKLLINKLLYLLILSLILKYIQNNKSTLKIFIMAHKDFESFRYNPVYSIVVDDKTFLKNKYNINKYHNN